MPNPPPKPSPNAPNPQNLSAPTLPRSGLAAGIKHDGWYCHRTCIHKFLTRINPSSSYARPAIQSFLTHALANEITAPIPDLVQEEEMKQVVFVKKTTRKKGGEEIERRYYFVRVGEDDGVDDGERKGKGDGKENEKEGDMFVEIRSHEFDAMRGLEEFEKVRMMCEDENAEDVMMRFEVFVKKEDSGEVLRVVEQKRKKGKAK